MLAPYVASEIKRLLTLGLSYRNICKMTGASRGTIGDIASGKRPKYEARLHADDGQSAIDDGPKVRCLDCGGMATSPCRLCETRRRMGEMVRRHGAEAIEPDALNLQLRPEHHARYEGVREARRKAEQADLPTPPSDEPNESDEAA
jgi:hypothetical protein